MDKSLIMDKICEYYRLIRNIDFAKFFEISEPNVYSWKKGGYNIYSVYQHCPEINPEWLLSCGEAGDMLREVVTEEDRAMQEDCRQLLDKSMTNVSDALARLAEEQAISKQVLSQTDKVLELVRSAKG